MLASQPFLVCEPEANERPSQKTVLIGPEEQQPRLYSSLCEHLTHACIYTPVHTHARRKCKHSLADVSVNFLAPRLQCVYPVCSGWGTERTRQKQSPDNKGKQTTESNFCATQLLSANIPEPLGDTHLHCQSCEGFWASGHYLSKPSRN